MKRIIASCVLAFVVLAGTSAGEAAAKVRVVTSTTDLASITELVGGDLVDVTSLAKGTSDPHFVEVLPSYMIKVKRAQVYLKVGLDLDRWADQIIDGSRNNDIVVVDCSKNIVPLNVPTGKVDASMGDVHPRGNPHYWLDPENGLRIAEEVTDALIAVDGGNADRYRAGLDAFRARLDEKRADWEKEAAPLQGLEIVTYHDSWPYFSRAFGIDVVDFVQPKPGIEPTPSHTAQLVDLIRSRGIKVIGVEPYFSRRAPDTIARETDAKVVELPPSVDGADGTGDYFSLIDTLIRTLLGAVQEG